MHYTRVHVHNKVYHTKPLQDRCLQFYYSTNNTNKLGSRQNIKETEENDLEVRIRMHLLFSKFIQKKEIHVHERTFSIITLKVCQMKKKKSKSNKTMFTLQLEENKICIMF